MIKKVLMISTLLLLFMVGITQATDSESNEEKINLQQGMKMSADVSKQAPEFSLRTLEGNEVKLSDYKGKKVIINFWATWCPPCKAEMPAMQKLYERVNGQFDLLAINIDPKNDVAGFVNDNRITFPVLLDESGKINESYSILSVPTTFLVDEKGIIVKKHIGAMTLDQMEEFISY
ncbi:Peroxiredoxin [Mesobacillus persicus]|uniref:Peroxiredoxin n=1 Tax=Mesobacillus persicus TaxID=930146 RepID=A0A1H7W6G4_9BACI|nr:redoxin domain-containing protein [Mesobacillus persicus]SEM17060.1 Peroxiredoxin [Mesobacillus persicus]